MIRFLDKSHNFIYFLRYFLLACLCLFVWQKPVWAQYTAAPEYADLQQKLMNQVDFTDTNSVPLRGSWQYYPEQLIVQPSPVLKAETVSLPVSFKEISGTNQTYGTFIGYFKIPQQFIGRRIAISIPSQYGAYSMYLDGDFILSVGKFGKNKPSHRTEKVPRIAFFVAKKAIFHAHDSGFKF